jgi:hypothetical protein
MFVEISHFECLCVCVCGGRGRVYFSPFDILRGLKRALKGRESILHNSHSSTSLMALPTSLPWDSYDIHTDPHIARSAAVLRPMNSRITELEGCPFYILLYSPLTPSDLSKSAKKGYRSVRGHIIGTNIFSNKIDRRFKGNTEWQARQNSHSLRKMWVESIRSAHFCCPNNCNTLHTYKTYHNIGLDRLLLL